MKPQIIYDHGQPAFVVLPYKEYLDLTGEEDEFIPFRVPDYVSNPIRAARIEAGLTQKKLAVWLDVSQAYIAKIERPGHKPSEKVLARVRQALTREKLKAA